MKKIVLVFATIAFLGGVSVNAQLFAPEIKVMNTGGNVGIGTSSPSAVLEVKGISNNNVFKLTTPKGERILSVNSASGNPYVSLYDVDGETKRVHLNSKGSTYFNGGNVGIGFYNPRGKLSIKGGISTVSYLNGVSVWSSGGSAIRSSISVTSDDNGRVNLYNSSTALKVLINSDGVSYFTGGNVGIGTTNPQYKLEVNGNIKANNVSISMNNVPDYVFQPNYNLKTVEEVESFVNENKHLPDVPSAKDFEENGVDQSEMNKLLLKKIEELTLYIIDQQKQINDLQKQVGSK